MTGDLTKIPHHELDRVHELAKVGLTWALRGGSERVYRGMEDLEERARLEKVRRQREREGRHRMMVE